MDKGVGMTNKKASLSDTNVEVIAPNMEVESPNMEVAPPNKDLIVTDEEEMFSSNEGTLPNDVNMSVDGSHSFVGSTSSLSETLNYTVKVCFQIIAYLLYSHHKLLFQLFK